MAAGRGCLRPGGSRRLGARLAQQVPLQPLDVLLHVLSRLGRGRRFGAQAPRHQPVASSARPRGQGPPPPPGGPVPGPDGGLGHNRGDTGHPSEHPRGPGPVQKGQGHPQHLGPAVITSHPGIVAQAARMCQAPGLPLPRRCRPAGGRAAPVLSSGRIRASTPPLTCSTGISWQGCGTRVTSCSPVRKYPAPGTQARTLVIPSTTSSTWVSRVHGLGRALRPGGRGGRGDAGPDSLAAPARGFSEGKSYRDACTADSGSLSWWLITMTDEPGILAITPASCMAALTSQSSPSSAGCCGVAACWGAAAWPSCLFRRATRSRAASSWPAWVKGRARSSLAVGGFGGELVDLGEGPGLEGFQAAEPVFQADDELGRGRRP